jgi:hypothetical protein
MVVGMRMRIKRLNNSMTDPRPGRSKTDGSQATKAMVNGGMVSIVAKAYAGRLQQFSSILYFNVDCYEHPISKPHPPSTPQHTLLSYPKPSTTPLYSSQSFSDIVMHFHSSTLASHERFSPYNTIAISSPPTHPLQPETRETHPTYHNTNTMSPR